MKRRDVLFQFSGALLASRTAWAQAPAYPNKPITIVVPFAAGGSVDVVARLVGQHITAATGQPVIVENKGGANGNIGATYVAKSPADGYRILLANMSMMAINPILYKDAGVDMNKDLVPVSHVANTINGLAVHPSLGVNTVAELIALARKTPDGLMYGSSGAGSGQHIAGLMLARRAGIKLTHVSYRGGGPMITDLLSGSVKIGLGTMGLLAPHVRAGKLKVLAIGEKSRFPAMPDVPTVSETVPGVDFTAWFGFVVPTGTPAPVIDFLASTVNRALKTPDVKAKFEERYMMVVADGPRDFAQQIQEDQALQSRVIREEGIKLE